MKNIFIVTGISGSGKSQALKCFEDFGFHCIDNIPVKLIPYLQRLILNEDYLNKVAIGIDIREMKHSKNFTSVINCLNTKGTDCKVIFLDCQDNVIIQRFSETRHRHPLGENLPIAIKKERKILAPLKEQADRIIDTTKLTLGELKEIISSLVTIKSVYDFKINLISFGYKYGVPIDADIVMDVRFLPNPYYIKGLKNLTGIDKAVKAYLYKNVIYKNFISEWFSQLKSLIPLYIKEGKSFLTIAVGCTGGKHRSVCVVNHLVELFKKEGYDVSEFHRDMRKR
ncbi:MAG: RNase adapter RapZ [Elusimicrobiales bacterium]|nr:RNase adapter RapZ [Elusimicrobiales bacterium]